MEGAASLGGALCPLDPTEPAPSVQDLRDTPEGPFTALLTKPLTAKTLSALACTNLPLQMVPPRWVIPLVRCWADVQLISRSKGSQFHRCNQ